MKLILAFLLFCSLAKAEDFKLTLLNEPHSLDPATLSGTETAYVFTNLFRGLYRYDDEKGLVSEGAKSCEWRARSVRCVLNENVKWSTGEPVLAEDYVRAFRRIVDPSLKSREAGLLLSLKNAKSIIEGKLNPEKLGITALSPTQLQFDFDSEDFEFLEKLTSQVLVPLRKVTIGDDTSTYFFNGPYQIKQWSKGRRIILEPNPHYVRGNPKRPNVEVLFVEEANTVLNLYDLGKISFVSYLATSEVPVRKNRPDFFRSAFSKFDYVGFGPQLKNFPRLREALSHAADFEQLQALYEGLGIPGCPSLMDGFLARTPCIKFDPEKAKKAMESVDLTKIPKLVYTHTKIAADDLTRGAEWYQAQWKKNIGVNVEIQARELAMFRQDLRTHPPALFRVGISLDRPTCLAALETFHSHSPDNHIKYSSREYDQVVEKLKKTKSQKVRKDLCSKGVELLLRDYALIPQGKMYYARLLNPQFKGLRINSLGQMDFSQLEYVSK